VKVRYRFNWEDGCVLGCCSVLAASIIRVIALTRLHDATTQKTAIFILAAVKT
jgi:hypothetical protein